MVWNRAKRWTCCFCPNRSGRPEPDAEGNRIKKLFPWGMATGDFYRLSMIQYIAISSPGWTCIAQQHMKTRITDNKPENILRNRRATFIYNYSWKNSLSNSLCEKAVYTALLPFTGSCLPLQGPYSFIISTNRPVRALWIFHAMRAIDTLLRSTSTHKWSTIDQFMQ